ncbi:uncharacterized protein EV154DRAFT_486411 [Mucor mucedo]|uniref:uncharacterized protein n=1 Tax=Mucor mucedo TaxID=29922 RepID=UPI0022211981|nr:uncharacterized protein EV154DRAFT_486411 [Mucor mucedo]KAI7876793.1 hypothetical protein EV154DRAFT_486411 [Mucor mucedo]
MVCEGCNKPKKQVRMQGLGCNNMTKGQIKEALGAIKFKLLKEVQKSFKSDICYLHFSTVQGAAFFYNAYHENGIILNNMHYTILPAQFPDGTVVNYSAATPT